jgi:hypothetical protein
MPSLDGRFDANLFGKDNIRTLMEKKSMHLRNRGVFPL